MSKLRVYQIAKDFQISSEALLEVLRVLNVEVKSHMSTVDDSIIEQVRQKFHREQEVVKAEETRKQAAKALADKSHGARPQAGGGATPSGPSGGTATPPVAYAASAGTATPEKGTPAAARPVTATPATGAPGAAAAATTGESSTSQAPSAPPPPLATGAPRPGGGDRSTGHRPGDRPASPRGPGQAAGGSQATGGPQASGGSHVAGPQVAGSQGAGSQGAGSHVSGGTHGSGGGRPGSSASFTPAGGRPAGGAGAAADARRFGGGSAATASGAAAGPTATYSGGARPSAPGGSGPAGGYGGPPRPGGGGGPQGNRRKDKKKKRTTDDRLVRESVKKTLATMERGGAKHRRRRVREDGSVIVEDEKVIRTNEFITLSDLADNLEVKPSELIALCLRNGMMVTLNKRLDRTEIELLAAEYGYGVELMAEYGEELLEDEEAEAADEALTPRPPVVTIMGHVDHGKTSLLDYVRRTNVVAGEVGGITQHIGAYEVDLGERGSVTFLDTPGHEAFTAMRARGAQATDIVVLVVAADSRVMPQTIEAIDHAREAQVPIVVAINKIDLPDSNPALIKGELAKHGLLVEEYGGKVVCAEISAKKGIGVEKLLDLLLLQAELLELKANADKLARGVVIESQVEKGRGIVGTVLVQSGTLSVGDPFLCGSQFGKVRAMADERGKKVIKAGPSTPVEILGWSGTPQAGDSFVATESEQEARAIAQERAMLHREAQRRRGGRTSLTDFSANVGQGEMTELRIILKGDVAGSVEAISEKLVGMGNTEVKCRLIHTGVGQITESDVNLAMASDAVIIGFHVRPDPRAGELARREKVDVRLYEIIYDLTEDIKSALSGLLKPEEVEKVLGVAEVRQVFQVSKAGSVAGCMVTSGGIVRNNRVRLRRDGEIVWDGKISTLKRFKDDAREVLAGFECGISLEGHNDVREGDHIESFEIQMIARRVE